MSLRILTWWFERVGAELRPGGKTTKLALWKDLVERTAHLPGVRPPLWSTFYNLWVGKLDSMDPETYAALWIWAGPRWRETLRRAVRGPEREALKRARRLLEEFLGERPLRPRKRTRATILTAAGGDAGDVSPGALAALEATQRLDVAIRAADASHTSRSAAQVGQRGPGWVETNGEL